MNKGRIMWVLKRGIFFLIRLYQLTFSILLGPCCRFTPSCSSYASLSIERFGIMKGTWLALKRLIKCHPLHPGGYDPVPENPTIYSHPACPEPARFGACRLPALYQDGSGPVGRQGRQEWI